LLLYSVAFQLRFPWMTDAGSQPASNIPRFDCEDWNESNVGRRVKNALAYLDYQSHKYRDQRWSAERWHYINGRRLLHDTFAAPTPSHVPAPVSVEFLPPTRHENLNPALAKLTRNQLVDALLNLDKSLTDRALLMRLTRHKLSVMLQHAWHQAIGIERRSA
jgi:hypothetical protein